MPNARANRCPASFTGILVEPDVRAIMAYFIATPNVFQIHLGKVFVLV